MKPLVLALAFLTRLPVPAPEAGPDDQAHAIRWFPLAGLAVGLIVAAAAWIGLRHDPSAGALCALLAWVAITGALHLDGLGDIADAVGAAHGDRARLSAVLADPHIGSFGVVAIALLLITKLVLLRLALEQGAVWSLILVPVLARIGPLVWSLALPPLHEGIGTLFRAGASWWAVALWLAALAVAAMALAPSLLAGLLTIPLWALWLRRKIGGISGDGHGAGIELTETMTLAAWVFIR
jgi:adenosylcobinamide-GDP ribazoletransferase